MITSYIYTRGEMCMLFFLIISLDKLIIINMRISLIFPAPVNEKQTDVAVTWLNRGRIGRWLAKGLDKGVGALHIKAVKTLTYIRHNKYTYIWYTY